MTPTEHLPGEPAAFNMLREDSPRTPGKPFRPREMRRPEPKQPEPEVTKTWRHYLPRINESAISNVLLIGGLSSIVYGAWLTWHPAAWILAGIFALGLAVILAEPDKQ